MKAIGSSLKRTKRRKPTDERNHKYNKWNFRKINILVIRLNIIIFLAVRPKPTSDNNFNSVPLSGQGNQLVLKQVKRKKNESLAKRSFGPKSESIFVKSNNKVRL